MLIGTSSRSAKVGACEVLAFPAIDGVRCVALVKGLGRGFVTGLRPGKPSKKRRGFWAKRIGSIDWKPRLVHV